MGGQDKSDVTQIEEVPHPSDGSLSSWAHLAQSLSRFILILPRGAEKWLQAPWGAGVPSGAEMAWKSQGTQ